LFYTGEYFISNVLAASGQPFPVESPLLKCMLMIDSIVFLSFFSHVIFEMVKGKYQDRFLLFGILITLVFTLNDILAVGLNLPIATFGSFALLPELYSFAREIQLRERRQIKGLKSELGRMEKVAALGFSNAALAHDVRNFLSIVKGNAYIAKSKIDDKDLVLSRLDKIRSAANACDKILNTFRRMASRNSGESHDINDEDLKCNLLESVNAIEELFAVRVGEMQANISIHVKNHTLLCNGTDLTVLLMNLTKNALDFVEGHPEGQRWLKFEDEHCESYFTVRVSNGGPKWSPENPKDIFLGATSTHDVKSGSGLGLKIISNVSDLIGTSVHLDTKAEDTAFLIQFPIDKVEFETC